MQLRCGVIYIPHIIQIYRVSLFTWDSFGGNTPTERIVLTKNRLR